MSLARALLGAVLVHDAPRGRASGRIVEVEAYRGPRDRAAHSYGLRRTPRNEVMYGPPGHAYVYFVYGMHFCFNVVGAEVDCPEAVLVRGVEPLEGLEQMRLRRALRDGVPDAALLRGPGNVCRGMGIDRSHNGADLLDGALRIEPGEPVASRQIARAPRVGVDYAGADAQRLWRFYVRDSPAVSKR